MYVCACGRDNLDHAYFSRIKQVQSGKSRKLMESCPSKRSCALIAIGRPFQLDLHQKNMLYTLIIIL